MDIVFEDFVELLGHVDDVWQTPEPWPLDASEMQAIDMFAAEFGGLGQLAWWVENWVLGAAIRSTFKSGTEGVRLELVDSVSVRMRSMYGHFQEVEFSRTQFRAILDALLRVAGSQG
jgi:hypothetical protein